MALAAQDEHTSYAAQFMLQEHSRIIDAYHDLHVQKNELVKIYLTFASLPLVIVTIFLSLFKYLQPSLQTQSLTSALRTAAICLSILLVLVGTSVLMSMLRIRAEQYLYIKTINAARSYFHEEHLVPQKYLILPTSANELTFGQAEPTGRAFWEAMIVCAPNSLLVAFLVRESAYHICSLQNHVLVVGIVTFFIAALAHVLFVETWIRKTLTRLGLEVR